MASALPRPEAASYRALSVQIVVPRAARPRATPQDCTLILQWAFRAYASVRADEQHDIRTSRFQSTESTGAKQLYHLLYDSALAASSRVHGILTTDWNRQVDAIAVRPAGPRSAEIKAIITKYGTDFIIPAVLAIVGRFFEGLGPMAEYLDLLFPLVNERPPSNPNVIHTHEPLPPLEDIGDVEEGCLHDNRIETLASEAATVLATASSHPRALSTRARGAALARHVLRPAPGPHAPGVHLPTAHAAVPVLKPSESDAAVLSWFRDPSLDADRFKRRVRLDRIIPLQVFPFVLLAIQDIYSGPGDAHARHECKNVNDPFTAIRELSDIAAAVSSQCVEMRRNASIHDAISVDPDEVIAVAALNSLVETVLPAVEEVLRRSYEYTGPSYVHGSYGAWRSIGRRLDAIEAQVDSILSERDMAATGTATPVDALTKQTQPPPTPAPAPVPAAPEAPPRTAGVTVAQRPLRFAAGKLSAQQESSLVGTFDGRIRILEAKLAHIKCPSKPVPPKAKKRKAVSITPSPTKTHPPPRALRGTIHNTM